MAEAYLEALKGAARLAAQRGLCRFTRFLDPAQAAQARLIAQSEGVVCSLWGGYAQAERTIACFHPREEIPVAFDQYPLRCLHTQVQAKFNTITHRDLLGAFMALDLTRSCIGDIIIRDADVFLFATEQTAAIIASSLTSAGKVPLDFSVLDEIPLIPEPKGCSWHAVVSSLRLDAVLACAYRLSRSEASDCIRAGLVKVDHIPCERIDMALHEGSLLSVRGRGRVRLDAVNGITRKQRIGITLFRYE